jgi:hypothetical protein
MLRIELDNPPAAYRPGSIIRGRVFWEQPSVPKEFCLRLYWLTEGKGDEDSETAIEQKWKPTVESGSVDFQWELPRGPLSAKGRLIRIGWTLEAESKKPDEVLSRDLILSPLDRHLQYAGFS